MNKLEQLQMATTNDDGTAHRVQARNSNSEVRLYEVLEVVISSQPCRELLFLSNLVEFEACLDVTILDKTKQTPLTKAQKGTRRLNGETAVNMGEEKASLTENMFDVNRCC